MDCQQSRVFFETHLDLLEENLFEDDKFHGLDVVYNAYGDDEVVIGKIICKTDYDDKIVAAPFVDLDMLRTIQAEICGVLNSLDIFDLWGERQFKFYSVLYESF